MIGEMTDRTNQARAFSFMPLCWATGTVVGPIIGGSLSRPAEKFPWLFGNISLFREFPYLLPCLVGAGVSSIGLVAGIFFLEEVCVLLFCQRCILDLALNFAQTLVPAAKQSSPDAMDAALDSVDKPETILNLLRTSSIQIVVAAYTLHAFTTSGEEALLILLMYTPLNSRGVGFEVSFAFSFERILEKILNDCLIKGRKNW
jgi:MFS family permease